MRWLLRVGDTFYRSLIMPKSIFSRIAVIGILAVSLSPVAMAENGWFVGGSIGKSSIDDTISGFSFDSDSTGYRAFVGYQFNQHFAVDGGYSDLGNFDAFIIQNMMPVPVNADADGFLFNATGLIPLNDTISLYGQAGVFFWDGKAQVAGVDNNVSDTNLRLAIGIEANVYKRLSITGDWSRYDLDGTDADVLALGFRVGL